MTFAQINGLAVNSSFVEQVKIGIVKAAIAISAESDQTPNHANRVAYARAVLANPTGYASNMAFGIATNDDVQAAASDTNVYNAIAGQWNAYAGTA